MKIGRIYPIMDNNIIQKKFRGCLLGGLLGDCLGAPFEGDKMTPGAKLVLHNYMEKLYGEYFPGTIKNYTDDTAMAISVAYSLIENEGFDAKDMAQKFVKEYYSNPSRGYGEAIPNVFDKLRKQRFTNIFEPAQNQFSGSGSYGNGGAMRIAPVALFYFHNYEKMAEVAATSTKLTHANVIGVNGALLQCIAIQQCLELQYDSNKELNEIEFVNNLIKKIEVFESIDEDLYDLKKPYENQLQEVIKFLKTADSGYDEKVIEKLGNRVVALYSVPTAIYCFLRATKPIDNIKTDNPVRRTIQYAISLGGDTDTIASMAGSLAGAYYDDNYFNESIRKHCELSEEIVKIADKLFQIAKHQHTLEEPDVKDCKN